MLTRENLIKINKLWNIQVKGGRYKTKANGKKNWGYIFLCLCVIFFSLYVILYTYKHKDI